MSDLTEAIKCIQAGDRATGKRLLVGTLKADPRNISAWIWLTEVVDSDSERIRCLQTVLRIDPNNEIAKQGLRRLQAKRKLEGVPSTNLAQPKRSQGRGPKTKGRRAILTRAVIGFAAIAVIATIGTAVVFIPRILSTVGPAASVEENLSGETPIATDFQTPSPIPESATLSPVPSLVPSPSPSLPTFTPQAALELVSDGTKIIYRAQGSRYAGVHIRIVNPDGSEPLVLAELPDWDTRLLDWSQDARWLLLSSHSDGTFALRGDGSGETVPLSSQTAEFGTWSPTAERALLVHREGLSLVDLASGQERSIALPSTLETPEDEFPPREFSIRVTGVGWAPNGEWFAFQTIEAESARDYAVGHLYRYDIATESLVELLSNPRVAFYRLHLDRDYPIFSLPVVSPNGDTILTDLYSTPSLSLVPADGGAPTILLRTALPAIEPPRWSPDGEWLAAPYYQDIYMISKDGSDIRNLTRTSTLIEQQLSWSPDGRYLACTVQTIVGGQDIAVYDTQTGQQRRITADTGEWGETSDTIPLWSSVLSQEQWQSLSKGEPVVLPPLPETSPGQVGFPTPSAPDPGLSLEPPSLVFDPPWWNTRYFYRRRLTVSSAVPIVYDADELGYPPMVEMPFDPTVISERLYYPVYGHDVHVAWWDAKERVWLHLPCDVNGLETEQALLAFPLVESLEGDSNAYYLYYGSHATVLTSEGADSLSAPNYPILGTSFWLRWAFMLSFTPGEYSDWETHANWTPGPDRLVVEISASDTLTLPVRLMNEAQGTLSLNFRPANAERAGVLLSVAREDRNSRSWPQEVIVEPFLTYDGAALHLVVGGQDFVTPMTWLPDRWYQISYTWVAGGRVILYVDGEEVSGAPYEPAIPDRDMSYHRLQLGATETEPGWAGQYSDLLILQQPLASEEVLRLYETQQHTTVTLGDAEESAVTTSLITPESGGQLRSPDGNTWIDIPPGAVDEPTTVSFVAINRGESQEHHLTRFDLVPFDWLAQYYDLTREEYATLTEEPLSLPFTLFYHYDGEYVEAPYSIVCFWYDPSPEVENWVGFMPALDEALMISVCSEMDRWGSYTIANDYGLGGPPRMPP